MRSIEANATRRRRRDKSAAPSGDWTRALLRNNGLSLVIWLFLILLGGQALAGMHEYNAQQVAHGQAPVRLMEYLMSGHFVETAEKRESVLALRGARALRQEI
jgi:hypothetical protein